MPQFFHRPRAYAPSTAEAAEVVLERQVPFLTWKEHLKSVYWEGLGLPEWSLDNPYRLRPPGPELAGFSGADPGSPPQSWRERGLAPSDLAWVPAGHSYQWASFRSLLALLAARGNRAFVLLGPFNTYALTPGSRARYEELRAAMEQWLEQQGVPYYAPARLPSEWYADASHPLGPGYRRLADELFAAPSFQRWMRDSEFRARRLRP